MSTASSKAAVSDNLKGENASRQNRIMIVVWSWQYGGMKEYKDEWAIEGNSGDKLVRLDLKMSPEAKDLLQQTIQSYAQQGDVFVFLHRRHGYNQKNIKAILEQLNVDAYAESTIRCFLFGEGNDKIYIVNQSKGLLGTRGSFSAKLEDDTRDQAIYINAIANEEEKLLKRKHFDFVWNQYSHNFKAKIFELKEDLFHSLSPFLFLKEIQAGAAYNYIKLNENQLLMLRLLSFIGKLRKGSNLETKLREFEQQDRRSYFFDDCHINLKITYGEQLAHVYNELCAYISKGLLAYEPDFSFQILRDQFDEMLQAMAGSTYD